MVPLVTSERVVFRAERAPPRDAPPRLLLPLTILGLLIGGLLFWLQRRAGTEGASRIGVTAGVVTWCIIVGVLGAALVYLRLLTEHTFAHDNTNVFAINPIWLLLVLLLPLARSVTWRSTLSTLAMMAAVLTALGVLAMFLPGFSQDSLAVAMLVAPANLVVAWIIRERMRPVPPTERA
jgi:hypothetical protein